MWKMIVTHMCLLSMWDQAKPKSLHSQIADFDCFEEWYCSELRGRMVQTLMQVSVQSLNVILQGIDMQDDKAVQAAMVLFRPLDGNVCAEVEHHNTRYKKDLLKRYKDNVTASGPNDIARVMQKVESVEDSKWHEAVTAQMINAKTHVGQRVSAMQSHANEVQLDFSESLRFSTPNYYKTMSGCGDSVYADSSSMFVCVYWGRGVIFVENGTCLIFDLGLLETQSRGPIQK